MDEAVLNLPVPDQVKDVGIYLDAWKNISGLSVAELAGKSLEHPIFGDLSLLEYIWVLILHEHHHSYILRNKYL